MQYIRKTYGEDVKIGGVGYCFGGRFIMRLMGSGVIDVGVVNHPSFYTLDEFLQSLEAERNWLSTQLRQMISIPQKSAGLPRMC